MITHGQPRDDDDENTEMPRTRFYVWYCETTRPGMRPRGLAARKGCERPNLTSSHLTPGHPNLQPWCGDKECKRRARLNPKTRRFYEFATYNEAHEFWHPQYLAWEQRTQGDNEATQEVERSTPEQQEQPHAYEWFDDEDDWFDDDALDGGSLR